MTTTTQTLTICVSLPTAALSPNARSGHWGDRHKAADAQRSEAATLARAALRATPGFPTPPGRVRISLRYELGPVRPWERHVEHEWQRPYRPLDVANAQAACKAIQDGVCDALGIPDTKRFVEAGPCELVNVAGRSQVVVRVEALQ